MIFLSLKSNVWDYTHDPINHLSDNEYSYYLGSYDGCEARLYEIDGQSTDVDASSCPLEVHNSDTTQPIAMKDSGFFPPPLPAISSHATNGYVLNVFAYLFILV